MILKIKYFRTIATSISILIGVSLTAQLRENHAEKILVIKKDIHSKDYSSTLDLNDDRMQLIMAGQNYNTNYGIYASINVGESDLGPDFRTLKKVDFEIVNYKPTYFIGIDSVTVISDQKSNAVTFKIYTRALLDQTNYVLNEDILKNMHFQQGSYLYSERYLNPMFPSKDAEGNRILDKNGGVKCRPDNGKAFDFEFFYMDGRHVVRKEDYDKERDNPLNATNEIALGLPGKRCNHSFNKIMF